MQFSETDRIEGKEVIASVAEVYKQLYLVPGSEGVKKAYRAIVLSGEEPATKSLAHFHTSKKDSSVFAETPAGKVRVVTLNNREDFELFLQIIANKCVPVEIPKTQGASIIDGVINWRRIEAHEAEFMEAEAAKGVESPDWNAEFKRFTSDKSNYLDAIIVLSVGPYSGIPAGQFGFSEKDWLKYSHSIRMYHECTHFICRRLYKDKIDPIWDELVADAVGIYAAFGRHNLDMASLFLGIDENGYYGGRLENYVKNDNTDAETRKQKMDELAREVYQVLMRIGRTVEAHKGKDPFTLAQIIEGRQEQLKEGTLV